MEIIKEDVITMAMLLGCLGGLEVLNIVFGAVMAGISQGWSWKKFLIGIVKALLVALAMLVFCVILDVLPMILVRVDIIIPEDFVTLAQVLSVVVVAISKYAKDVLEKRNFYAIDSTIQKFASGLGVNALGMDTILKNLSGGSRAKVILVKLLLSSPDVLILDEPTNFLDKEHIAWLASYLESMPSSFIIVSHDYDFLEKVTTCICDIEFSQIKKYKGPYSKFLKQKEANREEYIKQYEFQQKEIKKLEDYIAKNKARASTANMAKSREKRLNKMEKLSKPTTLPKPHFHFPYLQTTGQVLLDVTRLEVGYYYTLLPPLSFEVRNGDKLVITGFNGIGKSTLLKTLLEQIPSRGGTFRFGESVEKIGYFEQELKWDNPHDTPLHILSEAFPKLNQKQIRSLSMTLITKKLSRTTIAPTNS